jgi:hypothetical protein
MNIKHVFGATVLISFGILIAMIANAPFVSANNGCNGAACAVEFQEQKEDVVFDTDDELMDEEAGCGCGMDGCTGGESCNKPEGGCGCAAKQKVGCGCINSGFDRAKSCQKTNPSGCGCNKV